jgi:hypothetical protein
MCGLHGMSRSSKQDPCRFLYMTNVVLGKQTTCKPSSRLWPCVLMNLVVVLFIVETIPGILFESLVWHSIALYWPYNMGMGSFCIVVEMKQKQKITKAP